MKKILVFSAFLLLLFFFLSSFSLKPAQAAGTCNTSTCTGYTACACNNGNCLAKKNTCSNSTTICGGANKTPCCVPEWAGAKACPQSSCNGGAGCGTTGTDCKVKYGGTCVSDTTYCTDHGGSYIGNYGCTPGVCCTSISGGGGGGLPVGGNPGAQPNPPCYYPNCNSDQGSQTLKCNGTTCDTAFGPISTTPQGLVASFFRVLLSIVGVISVLLIIISGYKLMSSQGNPEKVQGAREQLTAAIIGLLFIIFSLVLLQTIGVDILRLPGFSQ